MNASPQKETAFSKGRDNSASAGFTLVEVLVVLAIIALLAMVAFPALSRSLEKSRTAKCLGNLKQLGLATLAYAADNNQALPPAIIEFSQGGMRMWYHQIRPYLGETNMSLSQTASPQYPDGINLDCFYCPSVPYPRAYPHTHYSCNNNVFKNPNPRTPDDIPQTRLSRIPRPSKVVMYTESVVPSSSKPEGTWQLPANVAQGNPAPFFPHRHAGTVNMVFCDGHAKNLPRAEVVSNFTNYFGDREFWK